MNRFIKYFSVFGILLVFAAYFFRLFEVNGFVKAISVVENPDAFYKSMGIIYKLDYFFIALIMVSCLVSFILMNKDKKIPLYSVSIIPIGLAIVERLYFVISSNVVAHQTLGNNISIINIINLVVLAIGLLSIINSILIEKFLENTQLSFVFSLSSLASITASTLISVYTAIIGKASIHFIIFTIFFLLAVVLFVIEFILKFRNKIESKEILG